MRSLTSKLHHFPWPWSNNKTNRTRKILRNTHRRLRQEPLESRMLLSVSPTMIDLDSASYSDPTDFVTIGDLMYFVAKDTDHGRELWATDGTEDGTYLVKDINDGSGSSTPTELIEYDGQLYFVADDGDHGMELWTSDGTEAGTVLVADIYSGGSASDSSPNNLVVVDDTLFFAAEDASHGIELWKSDGTEAGTVLVSDIYAGTSSSTPLSLTNADGMLFFVADDGTNGLELWASDGTAANTQLVTDINDSDDAFDADHIGMTAIGDTLFFIADDGEHGLELWRSQGSDTNTIMVDDIYSGSHDSFDIENLQLIAMGDVLYFAANDGESGDELWRSNGTSSGTYLLKDINPGSDGDLSEYTGFTIAGDYLYFSADDGNGGKELWRTDGTEDGTVMVKNIYTGSENSYPFYMKAVGDVLYFVAESENEGRELWKTDGTTLGTVLVADTISGVQGSFVRSLEVVNDHLMFSAMTNGTVSTSRELFSIDLAGTVQLSIWVDGEQVSIPVDIGAYSDSTTADLYTTDDEGTIQLTSDTVITIGDFFDLWRTNAGLAGNESDATFDIGELMGSEVDDDYATYMFIDGEICTDFENYVFLGGEEIVLVYSDNTVVSLNTNYGSIVMELFDEATPNTVANFLEYVNDGDFIDSIFHRSITDFIIQGGNSTTSSNTYTDTSQFTEIDANASIAAELGISNTRGTVAMARVGSNMSSATNNFFINITDNTQLDTQSGGYTVFGQVLDMTTADTINDLPIHSADTSTYANLPYDDDTKQLVVVESIEGTGTITGYKFLDDDYDGVFDSSEDGIEGVTVFVDANDNGILDDGEIWTTTDANGEYVLHVNAGQHIVRAEVTTGHAATVEHITVTVEIGEEVTDNDLGEMELDAPVSVDLISTYDTGTSAEDNITNLNNADSLSKMKFIVNGVLNGATVHIYAGDVEIGSTTASGTSVTITTDTTTVLDDGEYQITAIQTYASGTSDASEALVLTIDTTAPGDFTNTAEDIAEYGVEYTFDVNSGSEGEDGIFYSLEGAPDYMTIDADTGEISWTPTIDQAVPQEFDIVVSDAAGNTTIQSVDMTVLGVIAAYPDEYTVYEDNTLSVNENAGVLNKDDPTSEFGDLTVSVVDDPLHGDLTFYPDGSFVYFPDADFFGTDTFTYQATDNTDVSNVVKVTIHVVGTQDPPVGDEDSYTTDEDVALVVDAADGVLKNDSDVDGDSLTVELASQPSYGTIDFEDDGSFVYTPYENYCGTDTFTYTLSDGTDTTDPITVEIVVNAVDDSPTAVDDSYTMYEDDELEKDAADGVLDNDSDPDSSTLEAMVVSQPDHGTVVMEDDGSFTYTPDDDFAGTDTFTYKVWDTNSYSNEAIVTITVVNVSDDPTAEDNEVEVENDGTAHTIDVLANDYDPDADDSISITAVTQGSEGGTVTISNGEVHYTPASGFLGNETFTYTIEDGNGNEATATVTMTVVEGTGGSLSGYVYLDKDKDGNFDSDESGVPGVLITLTGTSDTGDSITQKFLTDGDGYYYFGNLPAGTYKLTESQPEVLVDGTDSSTVTNATVGNDVISEIIMAGGETYEGNNFGENRVQANYVTFHLFLASTFRNGNDMRDLVAYGEQCAGNDDLANDIKNGQTDYQNHSPVAVADEYDVEKNVALSVAAVDGVLANDTDEDDDVLTAMLIDDVAHGTLTLNSDGSFEYTPDTDYTGTDSFSYIAEDGLYDSDPVEVLVELLVEEAS